MIPDFDFAQLTRNVFHIMLLHYFLEPVDHGLAFVEHLQEAKGHGQLDQVLLSVFAYILESALHLQDVSHIFSEEGRIGIMFEEVHGIDIEF